LASVAKMVLNDFQRGKLPYYVLPPGCDKEKIELKENEDFIDKLMAEQEKREKDNPTVDGAETVEKSESKNTEVSDEIAQKIAQKIADKKNKTKAVEKKGQKIRELSGLKKKLKNWDKAQ